MDTNMLAMGMTRRRSSSALSMTTSQNATTKTVGFRRIDVTNGGDPAIKSLCVAISPGVWRAL